MKSLYDYDIETLEEAFEWRDIEGYYGLYKVSEYGDIMALNYKLTGKKKLLKPGHTTDGYTYFVLSKNGKQKNYYTHRLVATAFCEGADEFEEVNHVDEDKTNNHYTNLEWCTREYNVNYGTRNNKVAVKLKKKTRCIELDIIFDSIKEAAEYVNGCPCNISSCMLGRVKTASGYHWEYV